LVGADTAYYLITLGRERQAGGFVGRASARAYDSVLKDGPTIRGNPEGRTQTSAIALFRRRAANR